MGQECFWLVSRCLIPGVRMEEPLGITAYVLQMLERFHRAYLIWNAESKLWYMTCPWIRRRAIFKVLEDIKYLPQRPILNTKKRVVFDGVTKFQGSLHKGWQFHGPVCHASPLGVPCCLPVDKIAIPANLVEMILPVKVPEKVEKHCLCCGGVRMTY